MTPDLTFFAFLPDVGGGEMMIILLVVLLLFGGDQMPQMAKKLGKTISQFKKAANEVEREIKRAIDEVPDVPDVRTTIEDAVRDKPRSKRPASTAPEALPPAPLPPATTATDSAIANSEPVSPSPSPTPAPAPAPTPGTPPPSPPPSGT